MALGEEGTLFSLLNLLRFLSSAVLKSSFLFFCQALGFRGIEPEKKGRPERLQAHKMKGKGQDTCVIVDEWNAEQVVFYIFNIASRAGITNSCQTVGSLRTHFKGKVRMISDKGPKSASL